MRFCSWSSDFTERFVTRVDFLASLFIIWQIRNSGENDFPAWNTKWVSITRLCGHCLRHHVPREKHKEREETKTIAKTWAIVKITTPSFSASMALGLKILKIYTADWIRKAAKFNENKYHNRQFKKSDWNELLVFFSMLQDDVKFTSLRMMRKTQFYSGVKSKSQECLKCTFYKEKPTKKVQRPQCHINFDKFND